MNSSITMSRNVNDYKDVKRDPSDLISSLGSINHYHSMEINPKRKLYQGNNFKIYLTCFLMILVLLTRMSQSQVCDPPCKNGGLCINEAMNNQSNPVCSCLDGFFGQACEIRDCGAPLRGRRASLGFCQCADGWTGTMCNMCQTDNACNDYFQNITNLSLSSGISHRIIPPQKATLSKRKINHDKEVGSINDDDDDDETTEYICDNSIYPLTSPNVKIFQCELTDTRIPPAFREIIGSYFTMYCQNILNSSALSGNVPGEESFCIIHVWDRIFQTQIQQDVELQLFYCKLSQCSYQFTYQALEDQQIVEYECAVTDSCECIGNCISPTLQSMISTLTGSATVSCIFNNHNETFYSCQLSHEQIPISGGIQSQCSSGTCVDSSNLGYQNDTFIPEIAPEEEQLHRDQVNITYIIVAAVISFVLLFFLALIIGITLISAIIHYKSVKKEWTNISDEKFGAIVEFKRLKYQVLSKNDSKHAPKRNMSGTTSRFFTSFFFTPYRKSTILHSCSYKLEPGKLTGIMGPSGAGKTTLLDILAHRYKTGAVSGRILINGSERLYRDKSFLRLSGYVYQDDKSLLQTMTVYEAFMFAANMKLPFSLPKAEKKQRVREMIEQLGLERVSHMKIGDGGSTVGSIRGLSGGERRRVSIGMELLVNPHLLFLDEPTTGLDSTSARYVIDTLHRVAKKGRTVVLSIHQPSSYIFWKLENLIIMSMGGIVYAGPTVNVLNYIEHETRMICPQNYNPADFIMDTVVQSEINQKYTSYGNDTSTNHRLEAAGDEYLNGPEQGFILAPFSKPRPLDTEANDPSIHRRNLIKTPEEQHPHHIYPKAMIPYATSFLVQFLYLSQRSFRNLYRQKLLFAFHYIAAVFVGIVLGLAYFDLGNDLASVQNRAGLIFFLFLLLGFGAMSSLGLFITERSIFSRERANGYYYASTYFLSKIIFDIIPLRIVPPILLGTILYPLIGFQTTNAGIRFVWFLITLVLFNVTSGFLCIMIGTMTSSIGIANFLSIAIILFNALFSGVLLSRLRTPGWLRWAHYLSFWAYAYEAIIVSEFQETTVIIMEGIEFESDFVFSLFDIRPDMFYLDILLVLLFAFLFAIISAIILKLFVYEKR